LKIFNFSVNKKIYKYIKVNFTLDSLNSLENGGFQTAKAVPGAFQKAFKPLKTLEVYKFSPRTA
jgi:hypothetical protein